MDTKAGGAESSVYAALLDLEERSRRATSTGELTSIMIDETGRLLPYQQAALWLENGGVSALSRVCDVNRSTPLMLWLDRVFSRMSQLSETAVIAGADALAGADRDEWTQWLPAHAIWVALTAPDGRRHGTLMFARDEPWSSADAILLSHVAASYGSAWAWLNRPGRFAAWRKLGRSASGRRFISGLWPWPRR